MRRLIPTTLAQISPISRRPGARGSDKHHNQQCGFHLGCFRAWSRRSPRANWRAGTDPFLRARARETIEEFGVGLRHRRFMGACQKGSRRAAPSVLSFQLRRVRLRVSMSAFTPRADTDQRFAHVRFGPQGDKVQRSRWRPIRYRCDVIHRL